MTQSADFEKHELSWMLNDAIALFHGGRKYSSLLLLLCAVDALATRELPTIAKVGDRFRAFLKSRLPKHTRIENFNIHVPQHGDLMRLEEILYKFLRNPMVHEGARLAIGDASGYAVAVDWNSDAPAVRICPNELLAILGGGWVVDCLGGVVMDTLGDLAASNR